MRTSSFAMLGGSLLFLGGLAAAPAQATDWPQCGFGGKHRKAEVATFRLLSDEHGLEEVLVKNCSVNEGSHRGIQRGHAVHRHVRLAQPGR